MPALNGVSARQQVAKSSIRASPAEDISHLFEVVWQKFAHKIQHQRFAETELAFVGKRNVLLTVFDIVRERLIELVESGKFGAPIDLARLFAQDGPIFARAVEAGEFQGVEQVLKS